MFFFDFSNKLKLIQGDCLELMKEIPDKSVDMVLCDLPYGTTQCKWDKQIPLDLLWNEYKRISKDDTAIVLFSAQPFTTDLIQSNRKMFKYEIIWKKTQKTGFYNAKIAPLRSHENILVFYLKQPTYNPQKYKLSEDYIKKHLVPMGRTRKNSDYKKTTGEAFGHVSKEAAESWSYTEKGERYPSDVIEFSNWNGSLFGVPQKNKAKHMTRKPVPLLEYLIKTYTNKGDTVLDNCMGSGSTGVACVNTKRDFIGIEIDEGYYNIAKERIEQARKEVYS